MGESGLLTELYGSPSATTKGAESQMGDDPLFDQLHYCSFFLFVFFPPSYAAPNTYVPLGILKVKS